MTSDTQKSDFMWGSTPGKMFDLHKAEYTFWGKRGETLASHPKGKIYIRGFVPDEFLPSEGGIFKMFHHGVGGIQKFGQIRLDNCQNVIEEDGLVYFEDKQNASKYILVPSKCHLN